MLIDKPSTIDKASCGIFSDHRRPKKNTDGISCGIVAQFIVDSAVAHVKCMDGVNYVWLHRAICAFINV